MKAPYLLVLSVFICAGVIGTIVYLASASSPVLLSPSGLIAEKELALMIDVILLMLIVTAAVFLLTFSIAGHYRASNTKAVYTPNAEHGAMNELVWWAIPIEIVLVLGALTWSTTHDLDPSKALTAPIAPLTIEVVALPSSWLFIYPEQHIASVNLVTFPANRPLVFHITSDAPMNSFWIPELGGQMYAMTGMSTVLNLIANKEGIFDGRSANYSGEGFADMRFQAVATSEANFYAWVEQVRRSPLSLSHDAYTNLREADAPNAPLLFGSVQDRLYTMIIMSFMSESSMPSH